MKIKLIILLIFQLIVTTFAEKQKEEHSVPTSIKSLWEEIDNLMHKSRNSTRAQKKFETLEKENPEELNRIDAIKRLMHRLNYLDYQKEYTLLECYDLITKELSNETMQQDRALLHIFAAQILFNRTIDPDSTDTSTVDSLLKNATPKELRQRALQHVDSAITLLPALDSLPSSLYRDLTYEGSEAADDIRFRPTLMDFLGNYLITVLQKETSFPKREDYILTDSLFLTLKESDTLSSNQCLIKLYKLFITKKRKNEDVTLWHTLERLSFFAGKRAHTYDIRRKQLLLTYSTLYQHYKEYPLSSEILYRTAKLLHQIPTKEYHQDQLQAVLTGYPTLSYNTTDTALSHLPLIVELCDSAINSHPNSIGANHCRQLKNSICTPSIQLGGSNYIAPKQSYGMNITYRNISKLQFELYKADEKFVRKLDTYKYSRRNISSIIEKYLKTRTPDSTWEVKVPTVTDFTEKRTQLGIKGLQAGSYVIVCKTPKAAVKGITYPASKHHAIFSVSSLFAIDKSVSKKSGKTVFYICDRKTGLPKKGVKVQAYRYGNRRKMDSLELMPGQYFTDAAGMVTLPYTSNSKTKPNLLRLSKGNDWLYINKIFHNNSREKSKNITLQLFTDKHIYRPGQELYFKGIITSKWSGERNIKPVVDTSFYITLKDANYQPVDSLKVTTNRFGSVSGTFTLPVNALNGSFTLSSKRMGSQSFRVEEYKKPTFYVTMDTLTKPVLPGEQLDISGKVRAIAEYPLDSATVSYTLITRWKNHRDTTTGELYTNKAGSFSLPVQTKKYSDNTHNAYYDFSCTVINREGESHTIKENYTVSIDFFRLSLHHKRVFDIARETPSFTVNLRTDNNAPHRASGEICVYSLRTPNRPITGKDQFQKSNNFIHSYNKKTFLHYFPYNEYENESLEWKYKSRKLIIKRKFHTTKERNILLKELRYQPPGLYRVTMSKSGDKNSSYTGEFQLIDTRKKKLPLPELFWVYKDKSICEPGKTVHLYFGSSVGSSSFLYELYKGDTLIARKTIRSGPTVNHIRIPIKESHRGGLTACITTVKEGIFYKRSHNIAVPWSNKELTVKLESFRSPLIPGNKDQWKLRISGAKNKKVQSELLLSLYDASLERLVHKNLYRSNNTLGEHKWNFYTYRQDFARNPWDKSRELNIPSYFDRLRGKAIYCPRHYTVSFYEMYNIHSSNAARKRNNRNTWAKAKEIKRHCLVLRDDPAQVNAFGATDSSSREVSPPRIIPPKKENTTSKSSPQTDENPIKVRRNFQETALFLPHLTCDKNGDILVDVTMPDAITKWRLLGLAHTISLEKGSLNEELFTRKKLMVTPNVPRYVYEGDTILYSATIKNLSKSTIKGTTKLQIFNALTMESITSLFPHIDTLDTFVITKGSSSLKQWRLAIPETTFPLIIRITADGGTHIDAEERIIPVLKRKRLVTEALPLTVKANSTKSESFTKFLKSFNDSNITQQKLTFEYTGKPIWNVVKALPHIAKKKNSSSVAIFHSYYANTLASHITKQNPQIEEVFKLWEKDSTALLSKLERNCDLKELLLNQTPWVADAKSEQHDQQELAILFKQFRIKSAIKKSLKELKENQLRSGAFSWFPDERADIYTTQYLLTGFAHLKSLGVYNKRVPTGERQMIKKAIQFLDSLYTKSYRDILTHSNDLNGRHITRKTLHYLYGRSQFQEYALSPELQEAVSYYLEQTIDFHLEFSRFTQTLGALALWNFGQKESAEAIVKVIDYKSVLDTVSGGRYWKEDLLWDEHPIESHALMIEAYSTILNDSTAVTELKNWLLKEKQCNRWNSNRASAEACYAMLLKGESWIADTIAPVVTLGTVTIELNDSTKEAGSGYIKKSWNRERIKPEMANITVQNRGKQPAWGALYWSYFCDIDKISAAQTGLEISKEHIRKNSADDPNDNIYTIGERFTVKLTITTDRTMEYVHVRDSRAAALEPTTATSGGGWRGSLSYYKEINDASVDFFIPRLKKGTHTLEYELVISQKGVFSDGIAEVQCLYAPEFKAHTKGSVITVREQ